MYYYSALRRNELSSHGRDIEENEMQIAKQNESIWKDYDFYDMIFWKRQNYRYSRKMSGCQRLKEIDAEGWVRWNTGTICCCLVLSDSFATSWTVAQTSLVAQWLRIRLPMWETWVLSLDWKDPLEKEMALQYSCLENSMDRGAWGVTVYRVITESDTVELLSMHTWIIIHQAPLSMEFSRREYWSGLPFPTEGFNTCFLHWQMDSLPLTHQGSPGNI